MFRFCIQSGFLVLLGNWKNMRQRPRTPLLPEPPGPPSHSSSCEPSALPQASPNPAVHPDCCCWSLASRQDGLLCSHMGNWLSQDSWKQCQSELKTSMSPLQGALLEELCAPWNGPEPAEAMGQGQGQERRPVLLCLGDIQADEVPEPRFGVSLSWGEACMLDGHGPQGPVPPSK